MLEVFFAFLGMLLAVLTCSGIAIVIAHHVGPLRTLRPVDLASDPRVPLRSRTSVPPDRRCSNRHHRAALGRALDAFAGGELERTADLRGEPFHA